MNRKARRTDQHAPTRAAELVKEIEPMAKLLTATAQNLAEAKDLNWGHVGSLSHIHEDLLDLLVAFVIGEDEDEDEARLRVLQQIRAA